MSNIVCIRTFTSSAEAQIAKSFLEANEINAAVFTDNAGGIEAGMEFATGVRLMVKDQDKEKAINLLKSLKNI